ncbi:hypothetical protein [Candidatus Binatus soli]|uniref:hypothetical protein n=1 Tax=Candidatus Binatus soli TaxID=1953413 RepID=UPI003D0A051B
MMQATTPGNADADIDARKALWREICEAATQLAGHCTVSVSIGHRTSGRIDASQPVPGVRTWQLVEAISLLSILLRAESVHSGSVSLFAKAGPLKIEEDGVPRYVWAQQQLRGHYSDLGGRPDLIVTSSPDPPTPANVHRVVEVKSGRQLGAQVVRGEFGKAHDLRVTSYFIWAFYAPSAHVKAGARRLGLNLEELGFDSPRRKDLITQPHALLSHVAHTLEQARQSHRFATALEDADQEARRKLPSSKR